MFVFSSINMKPSGLVLGYNLTRLFLIIPNHSLCDILNEPTIITEQYSKKKRLN